MRYRRAMVEGATFFFTVNLAERSSRILVDRVGDLPEVARRVREEHPFVIIAWVVNADHIDAIWRRPENDADYSTRWALIKTGFSRAVPKTEQIRYSRERKGERGIWQRRFWEHLIRNDTDLQWHVDYTHYDPLKHGYVRRAVDWPFSSIHRYVRLGWVSSDWGCPDDGDGDFGERW